MIEQWKELKETIIEMRDNDGTGTQQEVCKFLVNYIEILEKQMNCSEKPNNWIHVSERFPKEYLCDDGYVEPSDYVLVRGDHGNYGVSRYWGNRRSKSESPNTYKDWVDLDWVAQKPIAWMPLLESYESQELPAVPAIPIPKNATNGDMIKAVFPHAKISQSDDFMCLLVDGQGDAQMFDIDWWNAPYKRGDELLEQAPCEDAVSRKAVLDAFGLSDKTRKYGGDHSGYDTMMLYEIQDTIESMPSVNPQPKTGHWIDTDEWRETIDGFEQWGYFRKCSKCGYVFKFLEIDNYCPNCGIRMVEPQERSEEV